MSTLWFFMNTNWSMVLLGWVVLQSFFKYESYGVIRFLFLKGKWGLTRREPLLWIFYVRIITPMTNQRNSHAVVSQWNQITWDFCTDAYFQEKHILKYFLWSVYFILSDINRPICTKRSCDMFFFYENKSYMILPSKND